MNDVPVRVSAKADYALRAMAELAASSGSGPVTAVRMSEEQQIPLRFLHGVLAELRRARLVRSTRGPDGGFQLARPAEQISLADVLRAVDGSLVDVHDERLTDLAYPGPAASLAEVWMAARTSLRDVFERVTLDDLAASRLPVGVERLAARYRSDPRP